MFHSKDFLNHLKRKRYSTLNQEEIESILQNIKTDSPLCLKGKAIIELAYSSALRPSQPDLIEIQAASERLKHVIVRTPLVPLHSFDKTTDIFLKPEILQPIGVQLGQG